MAKTKTSFQKGCKPGPGAPKGQRLTTRIERWLDKHPEHEDDLMTALIAMSTGRRKFLKDEDEEDGKRKPALDWFIELRELIQGKPIERQQVQTTDSTQTLRDFLDSDTEEEAAPEDSGRKAKGSRKGR